MKNSKERTVSNYKLIRDHRLNELKKWVEGIVITEIANVESLNDKLKQITSPKVKKKLNKELDVKTKFTEKLIDIDLENLNFEIQ